ncbi:MAG: hypothetical protein U1F37_14080 [Alphaproteobacteria bacterium]
MSAFNRLRAEIICPSCADLVQITAQFKYGRVWQYDYAIGDKLRWDGNNIGKPHWKHVVVDAVAETPCPKCGFDHEWNLYVHVENNHLAKLENATGEHDFVRQEKTYIVLRE